MAVSVADILIRTRLEGAEGARALTSDLRALQQAASGLDRSASSTQQLTRGLQDAGAATRTTAREQQRLADLQISTARTSKDFAAAQTLVAQELAKTDNSLIRNQQLLLKQAQITEQVKRAEGGAGSPILPRSFAGVTPEGLDALKNGAIGVAGALGLATSAAALLQQGLDAVRRANSLEQVEATTKALAGSTERYREVLETARQGQQRYGGSLEENLRGLSSLVNISNRAGVSLQDLDNIARRLATVDPAQGIEGAQFALREFFSGTGATAGRSLVDRFELPRQAIADLTREGISAQDRLRGLDAALNDLGITNEVLSNRTQTTAAAFDRLGAAVSNARDQIGQNLAEAARPIIDELTGILNAGSSGDQIVAQLAAASNSIDEFRAKFRDVQNTKLLSLDVSDNLEGLQLVNKELSAIGFTAFKAFQQQGDSATEAYAKLQSVQGILAQINLELNTGQGDTTFLRDIGPRLVELAATGDQAQGTIGALITMWEAGTLSGEQFAAALDAIAAANAANPTAQAAQSTEDHAAALQKAAAEAVANSAAQQEQAFATQQADEAAQAAARALLAAGNAAAIANAIAGNTSGIDAATAAYLRLYQAQQAVAIGAAGAKAANQNIYDDTGTVIPGRENRDNGGTQRQAAAEAAIAAALRAQAIASADAAGKVAILRKELAGLTPGTVAYINKKTELIQAERAAASASTRAGNAAESAANKAKRAAEAAARKQDQYNERLQRASFALLTPEEQLLNLREQQAHAGNEAERLELTRQIRDLEDQIHDRRERLLPLEQQLADLRKQQAETGSELERAELAQKILDIETKIADERERAVRTQIDLQQTLIDQERQRRDDAKERERAERLLASGAGTKEQQREAELTLQELTLREQRRQLDLADAQKAAAQAQATAMQDAAAASEQIAQNTPATGAQYSTGQPDIATLPGVGQQIGQDAAIGLDPVQTGALLGQAAAAAYAGATTGAPSVGLPPLPVLPNVPAPTQLTLPPDFGAGVEQAIRDGFAALGAIDATIYSADGSTSAASLVLNIGTALRAGFQHSRIGG